MGRKKRLKVSGICEANDHISRLHDDVLCSILSLLPLRDAIRTSVLSSRWRNLWKLIPHLDIVAQDFDPLDVSYFDVDENLQVAIQRQRARKFIKLVDGILNSCMSTGLATLKLSCSLHEKHAKKIDGWISFAIASGIKELHLQLDEQLDDDMEETMPYEFPFQLFSEGRRSSVTRITLEYCTLRPPPRCNGLRSLKVLDLNNVSVTEIGMQDILSSCDLERLNLHDCMQLSSLQPSLPCPQLKYLKITSCCELTKVELSAPNLFSFEYTGELIKFTFNNSPKLKRAGVFITEDNNDTSAFSLSRLHDGLAQVEFLYVNISMNKVRMGYSNKFAHLKHLRLRLRSSSEDDLLQVATILNAAPVLNTLELQLLSSDLFRASREIRGVTRQKQQMRGCRIRRLSECPHAHLRTVRINGFIGLTNQIELAIHILSNSMVLKLMTVGHECEIYMGEDAEPWIDWRENLDFAGWARKRASKFLGKEVPPGAKLVISQFRSRRGRNCNSMRS